MCGHMQNEKNVTLNVLKVKRHTTVENIFHFQFKYTIFPSPSAGAITM